MVPVTASVPSRDLYIHAGRLIDGIGESAIENQCITTRGPRIQSVEPCGPTPPGLERIDWSHLTVVPGLIDLHTHLADAGQSSDLAEPLKTSPAATALIGARHARVTLEAGFTSVRDVGTYRGLTDIALRNAIARGDVPGPRMYVAGAYLTIPGGGGELNGVVKDNRDLPADMRLGVAATPEEAAAKTTALLDAGADFIKVIATGAVLAIGTEPGEPELTPEQLRAIVAVAHARGKKVTAHAHGTVGIRNAILAGVDSIEHASLADEAVLQLAKERGVALVMDIYNGDYIDTEGRNQGWPEEYLRKNRETTDVQRAAFRRAVELGVTIGYGTDAGVYPHGQNGKQFAYMVQHGMTPMQAIKSATSVAARIIGAEADIGTIAPGRYADLLGIDGNPLTDISILERPPLTVLQGGRPIR